MVRSKLILCAYIAAFLLAAPVWGQQALPPNILWVIADDWGTHAGSYGTPAISTPNVDQIASEGVRFTNMFTTAPVCSTMRSALMTGMYQTSIGAHQHRTPSRQALPGDADVITQYFKDAGYWTGNGNFDMSRDGKTDYNFAFNAGDMYDGRDWSQRPTDTPFFQQVQIFNPHRDFRNRNNDPTRLANLDLPDYYPDHELARKDYADYLADVENFDTKLGQILTRLKNDGLADNTIVMVFGDHGAAHVRDKQWLYDGGIHVPLLIRDPTGTIVPTGSGGMVDNRMLSHIDISATSLALAGVTVPEHMQGEDFSASGYAGREAVFAARDRMDGVVDRVRSVQVGDMKLIRNFNPDTPYMLGDAMESAYKHRQYPVHTLMKVMQGRGLLTEDQARFLTESRPEFELYDLSADPNEFNNLAEDPAHAATLANLSSRIDQWMIDTGDMGGDPDPAAAQAAISMRTAIENTLADRVGGPDATDFEYLQWWAGRYNIELNLAQTTPDAGQIRLPNKSWENTALSDGIGSAGTPQGWTESNSAVVQNLAPGQMAGAHEGKNALALNSDNGSVRWAMDDNWGNLVEFNEALGWEIELALWVGRSLDSQGDDPGILEVSLQNAAGDKVLSEVFNLVGLQQGVWEEKVFTFVLSPEAVEAAGGDEQIYLALGNIVQGVELNEDARVLVDDMSLSITVPEPGSLSLLLVGAAGLLRRRRAA
jgi:uncharacterized sulfatase